jgi:hypothetical protein
VGEVLDQAFRLYRKNFLTFVAIIGVVVLPLQLAQQAVLLFFVGDVTNFENNLSSSSTLSSSSMNDLFTYVGVLYAAIFGISLLYGLLQSLSQGALAAEIANSHLDKPVSFGDGYRQMFSRLGPLLGVILLQLLIDIGIFIPVILLILLALGIGIGSSSSSSGGTAALGLTCFSCFLIIPSAILLLYVQVRLYVVTPVVMVERLGPVQTIRRSWELVRNYWWRTFALGGILLILGLVVQLGPSSLIQAILGIFVRVDPATQQAVTGLVTVFTTLIFIPVQLTAITLYYFDLRVRKEGYDIETALTQRYAMAPTPPPGWAGAGYGQPAPSVPAMPYPSLGQGQDQGQTYYGYNYEDYRRGAPTQPVGSSEQPWPPLGGAPAQSEQQPTSGETPASDQAGPATEDPNKQ